MEIGARSDTVAAYLTESLSLYLDQDWDRRSAQDEISEATVKAGVHSNDVEELPSDKSDFVFKFIDPVLVTKYSGTPVEYKGKQITMKFYRQGTTTKFEIHKVKPNSFNVVTERLKVAFKEFWKTKNMEFRCPKFQMRILLIKSGMEVDGYQFQFVQTTASML